MKFENICNILDRWQFLSCMKEVFRNMANLIFSHHKMTGYHLEKISTGSNEMSQDEIDCHRKVKSDLILDRADFFSFIERKVIKILRHTANFVTCMNIKELFEFLSLYSNFLELGKNFAGE
jgi:hypothetical protein